MTRLADFRNFLATWCLSKVAQIIGDVFGFFENIIFFSKKAVANFWATFKTFWSIFYFNIWSHWRLEVPSYISPIRFLQFK